jgi:UDP:flavonoid glycosyltransferase YjiC (YdhE family)
MARILVSTFGSSGDLNPFLALGLRLRERGHVVRFAVQEYFRPTVQALGLPADLLSGNVVANLAPTASRMVGKNNPIPSVTLLMSQGILPTLEDNVEELRQAASNADLMVTSFGQLAASFVADLTNIPWVTVALTPVTIPSAYIASAPQPFALPGPVQRVSNRLNWSLGGLILSRIADQPINRLRARYGLKPRRELLWLGNASERLLCLACSPAFQPRPPDWPAFVKMTGFNFWDMPTTWQASPELEAFLRDERPLVAVTAGSIGPEMRRAFAPYFHASIAAIRQVGARALLIGLTADDLEELPVEGVLALPFAPYSAIFPHCAAIIQHGGIGTIAQAMRFGVPALVVPWGFDQLYSASQVRVLGAGTYLTWRGYTVERAARTLRDLLHTPGYLKAARSLRDQIAREDGAEAMAAAIEEQLTR